MEKEKLNGYIEQLRSEITGLGKNNAEKAERLKNLADKIEQAVARGDEGSLLAGINLGDSIRQMEAEHPTITAVLDRIAKTLSNMGI